MDKYPISKNNRKCIGPCYEPNKYIIHPILLKYVTGEDEPFCPTNVYESLDEKGNKFNSNIDVCFKPTSNILEDNNDILYPDITFDPKTFLMVYYNINDYNESLEWLDNNSNIPFNTKLRILECIWIAFFNEIYLIDKIIIDLYHKYFINKVRDIYINIHNLIDIDIKENKIIIKKNKLELNDYNIERINFIIEKLLNNDEINKFLNKYYEKNSALLKKHKNIHNNFEIEYIMQSLIIYLKNKLENSIDTKNKY